MRHLRDSGSPAMAARKELLSELRLDIRSV